MGHSAMYLLVEMKPRTARILSTVKIASDLLLFAVWVWLNHLLKT